jgi:hypothetical protein
MNGRSAAGFSTAGAGTADFASSARAGKAVKQLAAMVVNKK